MSGRILSRALALTLFVLFSSLFLLAQDLDDVTISGKITDPNGLVVVGANVTVTSVDTGETRTTVTNEDGLYRFVKVKPGNYKIKASGSGFGISETTPIRTVSGQNLVQDFKMVLEKVTAETTVTVTEEDVPAVDTTRTVVGGTLTEREIEEIPNSTRNPLDLVLTLGGTSEEQLSTSGLAEDRFQTPGTAPLEQGNFSLSGGVAYSNNLTIDGLDNNDDRSSRDRFQPSLESIAEVQVITNQFSAEYGRASGGRVNLRTRAGSNRFRGRGFFFFKDESLNANSWYNNSRGFARAPLSDYNPGFTFSGPVVVPYLYDGHNRTFFSVAFEHDDLRDTTFVDTFVPIGTNPRFALPASNAPCPVSTGCNDTTGTSTPIGAYQSSLATPNTNNVFTARVDHKLTSSNDFTVGYQYGRRKNKRTTAATTTRLDDALQSRNSDTDAFNFTDNQVFGATAVNQFRAQYSIYEPSFQTDNPFAPVVLIGYRNPLTGANQTLIAGNSTSSITGDSTGFPQNRRETRYQFQDTMTYLYGRHSLKAGFDIQKVNSKAIGLGDATGTFNFTGVSAFLANTLSRYRQNFGTRSDVNNTYWGIFGNDELKLRSDLTVSFGLRYERETAVSDSNNFGPRVGVAWSPFKSRKGVIRFGSGVFYNRVLLRTVAESIQNTGGNQVSFDTNTIGTSANDSRRVAILAALSSAFPATYASVTELQALLTRVCPTVVNPPAPCTQSTGFLGGVTNTGNPIRTVEPNLRIPVSYQYNFGFEREVFKGWVFEANYTINKTQHLWRDTNYNVPVLPAGFSDWNSWLITHPFTLSPTRMYTFFNGPTNDASGLHAGSQGSTTACGTTTANCFVNLNTTSTSTTRPLVSVAGTNNNATGGPIGIALSAISQFRPDTSYDDEISLIRALGNSFYRGLILEMRGRRRKLGHGFAASTRFAYTLSKTQDDGLNNTANAEVNGDFSREWARSLQDRRHRIAISGSFDMPNWLGGLRFSPLFRFGTSAPFNLGNGGSDRNLDDLSTDRLNFSGKLDDLRWREPGSPIPTYLIAQLSLAPIGAASGNLPRNSGRGPSFYTFDMNVSREFKFGEKNRMRLRPVLQFDNILNAAVFNYGSAFIDFNNLTVTSSTAQQNFLVPTRTYRQRQIRAGLRFDF